MSRYLKKFLANLPNDGEFSDVASAIEALRKSPVGLDPTLEETLPSGVAYHHAGLTVWFIILFLSIRHLLFCSLVLSVSLYLTVVFVACDQVVDAVILTC